MSTSIRRPARLVARALALIVAFSVLGCLVTQAQKGANKSAEPSKPQIESQPIDLHTEPADPATPSQTALPTAEDVYLMGSKSGRVEWPEPRLPTPLVPLEGPPVLEPKPRGYFPSSKSLVIPEDLNPKTPGNSRD
ncbi:MAG: hypothetical protein KDB53_16045 [Planctomycetes bacterium]|nr:hypothetical protein [Planctomycetota bacterium]